MKYLPNFQIDVKHIGCMGTQTINNLLLRAPTKEVCWWRKCVSWDCFQLRRPSKPEWSWWRDFTRSLDALHIKIVVTWFLLNSIRYRKYLIFGGVNPSFFPICLTHCTQQARYLAQIVIIISCSARIRPHNWPASVQLLPWGRTLILLYPTANLVVGSHDNKL